MYNYVCAIFTPDKKGNLDSHFIKVGVTANCNQRFPQICKELEREEFPFGTNYIVLLPLFIVGGNYDKYIGERIEDVLRLYYLKKLGFDRGYKQDWINSEGLPASYDIEAENAELESLLNEWFPSEKINIHYQHHQNTDIMESFVFSNWCNKIKYCFGD